MDLRPLSFDEICQMEMLHAGTDLHTLTSNPTNNIAAVGNTGAGTVMPIMVIPTSMMPPGTILTATTPSSIDGGGCEHFYQLQPTHILTTAPPTAAANAVVNNTPVGVADLQNVNCGIVDNDGLVNLSQPTHQILQAQPILLPNEIQQQHPQQIPQQTANVSSGAVPANVNILYTNTLTRPRPTVAALTRNTLESATLPRGFQPSTFMPTTLSVAHADESDFEGSECGTSISATTCIPPFRFSGCGMILQPASVSTVQHPSHPQAQQKHRQQHQQHQHEPQVVGCGSLSHMMGSFAAAAGGAMQSGRFVGTLAGVSAGLSGTLGRNRRSTTSAAGNSGNNTDNVTQTPKRVSFKGDNLPPEEMQLEDNGLHADRFNNCSYMHFDNFMDYQTTGFGGLPDVTEHSNIRRTLSRQNSISNSDSGGEIASIQKSKVNFGDTKSSTSSGAASGKRNKSKAAQQNDNVEVQRYKSRRGSCVIGLTLMAAVCLLIVAATLAYQHFLMAPSRNSHAQRLKIVHRILREVPLVDGHNNFAWNVRKYAHSSLELVHLSQDLDHKSIWTRPSWAQTDIDRLKQGLVGVQVWSAYVPCEAQGLDAVQLALEQIDIVRRLADMYSQDTVLVTSSKDILAARRRGLMASLIGIEGGHAIGSSLGVLRSFYSLGARYLSLTHKCDVSWAGASVSPLENGLTQFGKAIIREMNRLGMMIDLSYSSDATARDVLQATRAPVIFSHSGARQLCNSTRNVPDDILRLVAENGGLIMISFDTEDVTCGRQSRLKDVIDHINYVRAIAGVQHIGIGAGYDGIEMPPIGLEDVSKYPDLLAALLEDHNWSEEDIAMLAGKNFLRIMETVENVRDYWKRAAIQPIEQTEPQPKTQCTYMSS